MANYSFKTGLDLPTVPEDKIIRDTNFTQAEPHTPIFIGMTGLTFLSCNLVNCDVPGDAIVEDCLVFQVSFCGHLHPEWVEKTRIDACIDECSHLIDTDEVWIDGVLADTIYHYKDQGVT